MYLFIDLKTKGVLGDNNKPYTGFDLLNISITKIAWLLMDKNYQILEREYFIALGEGYVSKHDFEKYSHSSEATVNKTYELRFLLEHKIKEALNRAKVIVYNDIGIKDNLLNYLYSSEDIFTNKPLEEKYRLCIIEEYKYLFSCELNNTFNLSLLYKKLFGKELTDDIDLLDSLVIVSDCFFRLKDLKPFNLEGSKINSTDINLLCRVKPEEVISIKGTVCIANNDNKIFCEQHNRNSYMIKKTIESNDYVIEVKHYNVNNTITSWEEYTYQYNNLVNVKVFNSKKGQISEKQYTYDDSGRLDQIEYFDGRMESLGINSFQYNNNGYLIGEFLHKRDWSFVETNYRYNGLGDIYVEHMHYEVDANFNKEYSKIDDNGNIVETLRFKGFAPDCVALLTRKKYDKDNNLSEMVVTKMAGEELMVIYRKHIKYEYTFDRMKNWVCKKEIINDIPSFIETRKIEYS